MAEGSFDDSPTSGPRDAPDVDFRSKLNAQAEDTGVGQPLTPLISIVAVLDFEDSSCISTVRSVVDQTFDQWEMQVVPANTVGGSGGSAFKGAGAFDSDDRITLVPSSQNSGRMRAAHNLLDTARGDYLCALKTGDLIKTTYLETAALALESMPFYDLFASAQMSEGSAAPINQDTAEFSWPRIRYESDYPRAALLRKSAIEGVEELWTSFVHGDDLSTLWLVLASRGCQLFASSLPLTRTASHQPRLGSDTSRRWPPAQLRRDPPTSAVPYPPRSASTEVGELISGLQPLMDFQDSRQVVIFVSDIDASRTPGTLPLHSQ